MEDATMKYIVHWRRNTFTIPLRKGGRDFVLELTRLFRAYADGSTLETIAMSGPNSFVITSKENWFRDSSNPPLQDVQLWSSTL